MRPVAEFFRSSADIGRGRHARTLLTAMCANSKVLKASIFANTDAFKAALAKLYAN
jgi:hypothetical protein